MSNTPVIHFDSAVFSMPEGPSLLRDIHKGYEYCAGKYTKLMRHCIAWIGFDDLRKYEEPS